MGLRGGEGGLPVINQRMQTGHGCKLHGGVGIRQQG